MKVAVLAFQGDVEEHVEIANKSIEKIGKGHAFATINKEEIREADALIIPGGESTTITKLMHKSGVADEIKKFASKGKPIMGTCAGCIVIGKNERVNSLGLIDIWVRRNAFGRQKESFEVKLNIKDIGDFNCIFIRAPLIERAGEKVEVLAKFDDKIVMAREKNILALSFHPELTEDTRIHEYFLKMADI
ncbi:MAG: pyridoxal 5'-phosphate synthase glutaminase subunit PdxT [Thermoplasmatales archaeon]|nr:pyridoxal 5'-phosphate synthase glutaminase subunit PdxT [Thermoplasmatales archaeon]